MPALDFDGDYGRRYRRSIRDSIPGYDVLHEIAAAAISSSASDAKQALVVGPGPGEELAAQLDASRTAQFTVLEPSEQMLTFCQQTLAKQGTLHRCHLRKSDLASAFEAGLGDAGFELVICHNVLHLFNGDQQSVMLRQLAAITAPGGMLLLSGYSEPEAISDLQTLLEIGGQRLRDRGVEEEHVQTLLASRNNVVFSLDAQRVNQELTAAGFERPMALYQGLFARLWLGRRPCA